MWRASLGRLRLLLARIPVAAVAGACFVVTILVLRAITTPDLRGQLGGGIGGTGTPICSPGACCSPLGEPYPIGTACMDDGNTCTQDICDGAGACSHTANPSMNGLLCNDNNSCTQNDVCTNGICAGVVNCDDGNTCTSDICDGISKTCMHYNICSAGSQASMAMSSMPGNSSPPTLGSSLGMSSAISVAGSSAPNQSSVTFSIGNSSLPQSSVGFGGSSVQASSVQNPSSNPSSAFSLGASSVPGNSSIRASSVPGKSSTPQSSAPSSGGSASVLKSSRQSSVASSGVSSAGASSPKSAYSARSTSLVPCSSTQSFPIGAGHVGIDIVSGPDGNLWIAEYLDRVASLTTAGSLTEYDRPGKDPRTIANGPDGNLWVAEYDSMSITKMTPTGQTTEYPIGLPNGNPGSITAGPDGNVWFTMGSLNTVSRITATGAMKHYTVPTPNAGAGWIITGPDDNLWFSEPRAKKIGRITPAGQFTEFPVPGGRAPTALVSGPDGRVWFASFGTPNMIYAMDMNGNATAITDFRSLFDMVLGIDGNFWYTNGDEHVTMLTPAGVKQLYVGDPSAAMLRLTVGPDGNIWATDEAQSVVWRFCPVMPVSSSSVPSSATSGASTSGMASSAGGSSDGSARSGGSVASAGSAQSGNSASAQSLLSIGRSALSSTSPQSSRIAVSFGSRTSQSHASSRSASSLSGLSASSVTVVTQQQHAAQIQSCATDDDCITGVCFGGRCVSCLDGSITCAANQVCAPDGRCLNQADAAVMAAQVAPLCGNGILDNGERCDDGNPWPGDGCDIFCRTETRGVPLAQPGIDRSGLSTVLGESWQHFAATVQSGSLPPGTPRSGPEAVLLVIAGASAGIAIIRRRGKR